ncbi:MAG: VOC family protein [Lewinellaceae bacterium]|nr:VOC family protein [Lewinellaceae bacterium]
MSIDHLIYAAPTLERGMDDIEARLGARPVYSGQHPGKGTHNALLALGPAVYLEVIAPDPAQAGVARPLWIAADAVAAPRLIYWAARAVSLEGLVERARRQGLVLGPVSAGSRALPDGSELRWRLTSPQANPADGIIPFFIDWGDTPHPAGSLPSGGKLLALEARHPEAESVNARMQMLGLEVPVRYTPEPALVAWIKTAGGIALLT